MKMAGGLGGAQSATKEIHDLVEFIRPFVQTQKGVQFDKFEAVSYSSQVVAGTNYFVKVNTSLGSAESTLLLRIFKPLPHTGEDAQLAGIKDIAKDDAIEHF